MFSELNRVFIFNSVLRKQSAPLNKQFCVFILTSIRYLNKHHKSCNSISISILMRLNKHTTNTTDINKILKLLLASGYIIKHNTAIRITPLGLQALTDIERQVKEGSYKIRKSDVIEAIVKRPKILRR